MKTSTWLRILYPIWTVISIFSLLYAPTLASDTLLFRLGQLGQIIIQLFQVAIVLLLYDLFKKTDERQAVLMVILALLAVPLALMTILVPSALYLAEVFWGLWLIPIGTLIIKSKLFPNIIGYFLYIGAAGYLGETVTFFLLGSVPGIMQVFTMGEIIWVLWITIIGPRNIAA